MKKSNEAAAKIKFADNNNAIKGTLRYTIYKKDVPVETVEEKNLIVTGARVQMAHLAAGEHADRHITKIAFGDNPDVPVETDTAITNPVEKNVTYSFPEPGQSVLFADDEFDFESGTAVQFNWELAENEANGKAIREFGLICEDGTLFSRRIRENGKPINKESDISIVGEWLIIF